MMVKSTGSDQRPTGSRLLEVGASFLKLGCISFGGPVAHLGYLREEYVTKRRWLTDEAYGDLVALCQFLPGPASSQVVFGLGMQRAGLGGALLASVCFTLPSAILMILFAYGVARLGGLDGAGWLHGLKLAAVAVVAQAVWGMGKKLCPDRARIILAVLAAVGVLLSAGPWSQAGVILLGALAGWWLYRNEATNGSPVAARATRGHGYALAVLIGFGVLLLALPTLAAATGQREIAIFDSFYRAGSLVFGGGHVVLPLLRAETVPVGWLGDDAFLAGYGAAQAVPGPLFTFAAYLGAMIHEGPHAWVGGAWCLLAIFLPAWLLIGGTLPFWALLRHRAWMQAALRGANAAVVGVLLAAFYDPVWREGVRGPLDVAVGLTAYAALEFLRVPAWAVVAVMAAAGAVIF